MAYQKDICWTLFPQAAVRFRIIRSAFYRNIPRDQWSDGHERVFWKLFTDDTTAAQALARFSAHEFHHVWCGVSEF